MKIKIKSNIVHKGKILNKDTTHDLPVSEADFLVEGGHADEEGEPKQPKQPKQPEAPKE
jgi:hypothetical protein